jgi:hypothetical protein
MSSPEASTYLSRQAARGASQREALAAAKLAEAAARVERSAALRVAGLSTAAEQAELVSRAAADKAAKKALLRERREERRARGAAGGSGSVESADTAGGAEVSAHAAPAEEGAPPCNGVAAPAVPAQLGAARAQTASARARNAAPAAAAEKASEGDPAVGRLVWNHSTHVDGLMPLLLKLLRAEAGVTTAIPGRITAGLAHRAALELEEFAALGAPLCGFSCVARVASSQQEVVLTTCPGVTLAAVVRAYGVARGELRGGGGGGAAARREGAWVEHAANVNRVAGDVVGDAARARAKAAHERGAEAQRAAQTQRDVAAVRKKLANSGAAKEKGYDLEAAAQAWAEQQAGGRGARGKYWGK